MVGVCGGCELAGGAQVAAASDPELQPCDFSHAGLISRGVRDPPRVRDFGQQTFHGKDLRLRYKCNYLEQITANYSISKGFIVAKTIVFISISIRLRNKPMCFQYVYCATL